MQLIGASACSLDRSKSFKGRRLCHLRLELEVDLTGIKFVIQHQISIKLDLWKTKRCATFCHISVKKTETVKFKNHLFPLVQ